MTNEEQLVNFIENRVKPFKINERAKSKLATLLIDFSLDFLKECIEISFSKYIRYDEKGQIEEKSFNEFFNKIGGIAHNRSLKPVEREISHILNVGGTAFSYWNCGTAALIVKKYVNELRKSNWTEERILQDLKSEVMPLFKTCYNWSQWRDIIEGWIDDMVSGQNSKSSQILSHSSIIPNELVDHLQRNVKQLCFQINASYENNLFDCTAVIVRRLLEILLIETFTKNGLENEIKSENGFYITLDKIIDKIETFKSIRFSATTKKDLKDIKNIGNFSAHKIWYNCTKPDIDLIKQKYRIIVEELLYHAGLLS